MKTTQLSNYPRSTLVGFFILLFCGLDSNNCLARGLTTIYVFVIVHVRFTNGFLFVVVVAVVNSLTIDCNACLLVLLDTD